MKVHSNNRSNNKSNNFNDNGHLRVKHTNTDRQSCPPHPPWTEGLRGGCLGPQRRGVQSRSNVKEKKKSGRGRGGDWMGMTLRYIYICKEGKKGGKTDSFDLPDVSFNPP